MKGFTIGATKSGGGKTVLTCAILLALRRRGLTTSAFKCGPDFIDALFHREVLGVASRNLDLFFSDAATLRELFRRDVTADVAVVEGVMGLFDGADVRSDAGSTYDVARTLGLPVLLLVDGGGAGRSLVASIRGFLDEDVDGRIVGVLLNQLSDAAYQRVKPVLEEELNLRVLGYLPKLSSERLESRYLGLRLPHEVADLKERLEEASKRVEECVDLDAILDLAAEFERSQTPLAADAYATSASCREVASRRVEEPSSASASTLTPRIAVALDEAFCFYYDENLRLLREFGAELVFFSPLHDASLPTDVDGLLLGGGYPELHMSRLASNRSMLASIATAYRSCTPIVAECGGFMYLHEGIVVDGTRYDGVGALAGVCRNMGRLVRFGYLSIEESTPRFLKRASEEGLSTSIRGHEFHYYDSENNGDDCVSTKPSTGRSWRSAHVDENRWLGFAHLYYPSNREFPKAFVARCARRRAARFSESAKASDVNVSSCTSRKVDVNIATTTVTRDDDRADEGSCVAKGGCDASIPHNSSRFFRNLECRYYPCHQGLRDLNCLFCFCPLYTKPHCLGNPTFKEKDGRRVKVCSQCDFPHRPENYDAVLRYLRGEDG